jgi:Glycosyl hydrolase family 26
MPRAGIWRFSGLPKEIVVVMLGVALMATVGLDLTGASARAPTAPTFTLDATGRAQLEGPSTTVASTTTTVAAVAPVVTTVAPAPPPRHTVASAASAPKPAPVRATPVAAATPTPTPRSARSVPFGVYVGSGDPSGVAGFAAATGTHPVYASDYLPTNSGWAGMSGAGTVSWLTGSWRGSGHTLVLGVPIIPTDASGTAQGTLAAGAAGLYNSTFVMLADNLVAGGAPNTVLRLGWEFNGSWYPWSVTNATDAANFASYFRNIVTAMRSVPGQAFKFVWNPNAGGSFGGAYTPAQAYPGSAFVDYIGIDMYDEGWSSPPTPQSAWANQLTQSWGLNWLTSFSAAEGRPMVLPEWGVDITSDGHGMGDDPYFVNQFANWIAANNVAWTNYFNFDAPDGSHDLLDGHFTSTLAAFRTAFG